MACVVWTALMLACWVHVASSSGTVRVRFVSYDNSDGVGANGNCCDGKWGICQSNGCDHVFTVCLHDDIEHSDDMYTADDCRFFLGRSGEFENMDSIEFGDDIAGIANPIQVHNDPMPETLSVKVRVEDRDSFNDNEMVDYLRLDIPRDTFSETSAPGGKDFTLRHRTDLAINVETVCDPHYYGDSCDTYCIPDPPGSPSHWLCDPVTGERYCHEDWTGENCDQRNLPCTMECQHGGTCEHDGARMRCACTEYYTGYLCQFNACEDNCRPGTCEYDFQENPPTYQCICPNGWEDTINTNPNSRFYHMEVCTLKPITTTTPMPTTSLAPTTDSEAAPAPARVTPASPDSSTIGQSTFECEAPVTAPTSPPDPNVFWVERGNADCDSLALRGQQFSSGVYQLHPAQADPFYAYCDIDNRGWTVIQRRVDSSLNFTRGWDEYERGFGDIGVDTNYWLGLENIYYLTNQRDYRLQIVMQTGDGDLVNAVYDHFRIEGATGNYALHVSGFAGNAGDSLISDVYTENSHHNGMPFSTYDRDNDNWIGNCAAFFKNAWWNNACHSATLNGPFIEASGTEMPVCPVRGTCIRWVSLKKSLYHSLVYVEMRIRPHLGTENRRRMGMARMGTEEEDWMAMELQKQEDQEDVPEQSSDEPVAPLLLNPPESLGQELEQEEPLDQQQMLEPLQMVEDPTPEPWVQQVELELEPAEIDLGQLEFDFGQEELGEIEFIEPMEEEQVLETEPLEFQVNIEPLGEEQQMEQPEELGSWDEVQQLEDPGTFDQQMVEPVLWEQEQEQVQMP